MNEFVVDSSVVVKWLLDEVDSERALALAEGMDRGDRLVVLDLVYPEAGNAVWKQCRKGRINPAEAIDFLRKLSRMPLEIQQSIPLMYSAMDIAIKYDRAVYDALFVALAASQGMQGVTADEALFNVVHKDFPQIVLLRDI